MEVVVVDSLGICFVHSQGTVPVVVLDQVKVCTVRIVHQVGVDSPVHIQDQMDADNPVEHWA